LRPPAGKQGAGPWGWPAVGQAPAGRGDRAGSPGSWPARPAC